MNEVLGKRLLGAFALVAVTLTLANLLPEPQALPPAEKAAKRMSYDLRPAAPAPEPIEQEAPPVVAASTPSASEPPTPTASPPPAAHTPPAAKPASVPARPKPAPVPSPSPTAAKRVTWYVQIGAFARETNAQNSFQKLQQAGLQARQDAIDGKLGRRYRVRCGPFPSREEAEAERVRATQLGFGDARVAPEPSG